MNIKNELSAAISQMTENMLMSICNYIFGAGSAFKLYALNINYDTFEVKVIPVRENIEIAYTNDAETVSIITRRLALLASRYTTNNDLKRYPVIEIIKAMEITLGAEKSYAYEWFQREGEVVSRYLTDELNKCKSYIIELNKPRGMAS